MGSHYDVPSWAAKAPSGLHLDVLKADKLTQKLMIDEKKCYLFGRNPQINDFAIDHASCSRVHAALVWHRHLQRAFLVDLSSTHGTFIGNMRLDARKPTQLPINSAFHFGASTRIYTLRERPQNNNKPVMDELEQQMAGGVAGRDGVGGKEHEGGMLLGLPASETELDNLTEFNTAHNRRITVLTLASSTTAAAAPDNGGIFGAARRSSGGGGVKRRTVSFGAVDEVINPEDVDPTVGRFRNLISTTIISSAKRARSLDSSQQNSSSSTASTTSPTEDSSSAAVRRARHAEPGSTLYAGLPPLATATPTHATAGFGAKLMLAINPAPDVGERDPSRPESVAQPDNEPEREAVAADAVLEPRKKKYAKEMWPGKKTAPSLLV